MVKVKVGVRVWVRQQQFARIRPANIVPRDSALASELVKVAVRYELSAIL